MKIFNIVEAVNELNNSINTAKEKGLITFLDISISRYSNNECKVIVYGTDSVTGRHYTSLELSIKNDTVYWENIPVGESKDLLPDNLLLHYSKNEKL